MQSLNLKHSYHSFDYFSLKGVSLRMVECRYLANQSVAPEELCAAESGKPPTEKSCSAAAPVCGGSHDSHSVLIEHNHTSKMHPQWRTGSWGSVLIFFCIFPQYLIPLYLPTVFENVRWRIQAEAGGVPRRPPEGVGRMRAGQATPGYHHLQHGSVS